MIEHRDGDIFKQDDIGLIIHQANCHNVFGAGIAKTIKELYPEAYWADRTCGLRPIDKLGSFTYADCLDKIIVNMYSQKDFGNIQGRCYTQYDAMRRALKCIRGKFGDVPAHAVPYKIGCGLAGGDWGIVQDILFDIYGASEIKLIICRKED